MSFIDVYIKYNAFNQAELFIKLVCSFLENILNFYEILLLSVIYNNIVEILGKLNCKFNMYVPIISFKKIISI